MLFYSEDEVCSKLDLTGSDVADWVNCRATGSQQSAAAWVAYTASPLRKVSVAEDRVIPCIQEHTLEVETEAFANGHVLRDGDVLEESVRPIEDQPLVVCSRRCVRVDEIRIGSGNRAA